jgi:hypothetical protein
MAKPSLPVYARLEEAIIRYEELAARCAALSTAAWSVLEAAFWRLHRSREFLNRRPPG